MAKIKICLDAGHFGKYNQSPAVKTYYESDFNWKFHLLLKAELEKYGIEVITTRKEQAKDMALVDRGKAAKGCDLFLSIHSNAVDGNVNEYIDYPVACVPIDGTGDKLGKQLAECVASVMGTKQKADFWSKKSTSGTANWYGVIHGAALVGVTGIILEHSFHTNTKSTKWLMVDSNLDKLAKAEAEVIAQHYGLKKTEQKTAYRVISGAYTVRKNADAQLALVRKTYPDAIMISAGGYFKIQIAEYDTSAKAQSKQAEVKAKGLDCYISTDANVTVVVGAVNTTPAEPAYTHEQFVRELQEAIGAAVDGIPGQETLRKTPTITASINATHAAVKPVQKWLYAQGFTEVGKDDGVAGVKFTSAIGNFQQENGCFVSGELNEWDKTWHKLLRIV